jgi:hypothetical protein
MGRIFTSRDLQYQVVGVVAGLHHFGLESEDEAAMYVPWARHGTGMPFFSLLVRTRGDPEPLLPVLRQSVWDLTPELPVEELFALSGRIAVTTATPRFYMALLVTFAGVALALAAGGIYASMLYRVRQRRRELGIRVALGAGRGRVVRTVVGEGARLALAGILVGLAAALALSGTLRAMVFGIAPTDPATFAAVAGVLALVAVVACWLPARRAAEADPLEVIRAE